MTRFAVARESDLPPGTMKGFDVGGRKIIVVNLDGEFHALSGICSHAYSELEKGFFRGRIRSQSFPCRSRAGQSTWMCRTSRRDDALGNANPLSTRRLFRAIPMATKAK